MAFLLPTCPPNRGKPSSDDEYNLIRARFGDTTSAEAQLAALRALGLTANFATNGDRSALEAEIQAGRPVAVGWLHHGPATAPTGGGHWSVVIGFSSTHAIHHDPNGAAQHYSWTNWLPRWEADGPGSGWWLSCRA